MMGNQLSLILLPTYKCNVACEYCLEDKTAHFMTHVSRPEAMIDHETCAACDYLSRCHGGCPVRAYSITGEFFVKDPYCDVYKALFSQVEKLATELSRARFVRSLPILQTRKGAGISS